MVRRRWPSGPPESGILRRGRRPVPPPWNSGPLFPDSGVARVRTGPVPGRWNTADPFQGGRTDRREGDSVEHRFAVAKRERATQQVRARAPPPRRASPPVVSRLPTPRLPCCPGKVGASRAPLPELFPGRAPTACHRRNENSRLSVINFVLIQIENISILILNTTLVITSIARLSLQTYLFFLLPGLLLK